MRERTKHTLRALLRGSQDKLDTQGRDRSACEDVAALLAPDVDLLNANGDFAPNEDGFADSLSIGLGFTAIKGEFTIP